MNLYILVIVIINVLQFTVLKCQRVYIEPKTNKTFLNLALNRCYNYGVNFQDFYKTIAKISNFKSNNQTLEVATFYNPELLGDKGPEEMGQLSYVFLQYDDITLKVGEDFRGLGILNYTAWYPIFRQNHELLEYYYNHSIEMETNMYPLLNDLQSKQLAKMRFEFSSKNVFTQILVKVKDLWPRATWGLFDYPKCNSLSNEGINDKCDKDIMEDNDRLSWLWSLEIALFPAFFIPTYFSREAKKKYVNARLNEAQRIAEKYDPPLIIVPYLSLNYRDDLTKYLSFVDLHIIITEIVKTNVSDNVILWSHNDNLNSRNNCQDFAYYLDNDVAPVLLTQLNNFYE